MSLLEKRRQLDQGTSCAIESCQGRLSRQERSQTVDHSKTAAEATTQPELKPTGVRWRIGLLTYIKFQLARSPKSIATSATTSHNSVANVRSRSEAAELFGLRAGLVRCHSNNGQIRARLGCCSLSAKQPTSHD